MKSEYFVYVPRSQGCTEKPRGYSGKASGLQRKSFGAAVEKLQGCTEKLSGPHGIFQLSPWNHWYNEGNDAIAEKNNSPTTEFWERGFFFFFVNLEDYIIK